MQVEITHHEAEKLTQLADLLYNSDLKAVIEHTYFDNKDKGYEKSQILDQDDIIKYARERKLSGNIVIEEVYISDLVDGVFDDLLNQIEEAKRRETN